MAPASSTVSRMPVLAFVGGSVLSRPVAVDGAVFPRIGRLHFDAQAQHGKREDVERAFLAVVEHADPEVEPCEHRDNLQSHLAPAFR